MLRFKFKIDVFEDRQRVLADHETGVYEFSDATVLANSIIRLASYGNRGLHISEPPGAVHIQLPPIATGYGPNTVHVLKEAIPVE